MKKDYNGVDLGERQDRAPAAPQSGDRAQAIPQSGDRAQAAPQSGDMWSGFGNGLSQAFEMAVVPALFALVGVAIDGWLGLPLVFTITLAIVGLVGVMARAYYSYLAESARADEGKPWARRTPAGAEAGRS